MNKRIILVRHGKSVGNADHAYYQEVPDYAITLNEKGHQQAYECGQELNKLPGSFAVFCSTHFRTRQTYNQIRKSINERVTREVFTPLIREQEWSNSVGKHSDLQLEKDRLTWGVFHYRFPGGESCADVYERMALFRMSHLMHEIKYGRAGNILIVGHGMGMRVQLMEMLGLSVEKFELMRNPKNCGIVVVDYDSEWDDFSLVSGLEYRENRSHVFEYNEEHVYQLGELTPKIHSDWDDEFA